MLLNFRQFSFISSISLLLANTALAGGDLSISPDQNTGSPQLQLESGSGSSGSSVTGSPSIGGGSGSTDASSIDSSQESPSMNAELDQDTVRRAQRETKLNEVSGNSDFILEVPVKVNYDEDDRRFGNRSLVGGEKEYEGYYSVSVDCSVSSANTNSRFYGEKSVEVKNGEDLDTVFRLGITVDRGARSSDGEGIISRQEFIESANSYSCSLKINELGNYPRGAAYDTSVSGDL